MRSEGELEIWDDLEPNDDRIGFRPVRIVEYRPSRVTLVLVTMTATTIVALASPTGPGLVPISSSRTESVTCADVVHLGHPPTIVGARTVVLDAHTGRVLCGHP